MKRTLLLLLFVGIILATSSCNQIVKVEVMIPQQLIPYCDWLLCFPGLQSPPETPHQIEILIGIGYGFVATSQELIYIPLHWRNTHFLSFSVESLSSYKIT